MAEPTPLWAQLSTLFNLSGVAILPSAIKGCLICFKTVLKFQNHSLPPYRPYLFRISNQYFR